MGSVNQPKASGLPVLRLGVIGTGWVSTMFVQDLLIERSDPQADHQIVAIGSSSYEKGRQFVEKVFKSDRKDLPRVYDNYHDAYNDANVDIIYVGTPHSCHMQNCLDAIAAGKHVLCEKPFAINEKEAQIIVHAARKKGVFIMEAVWTRFFPLVTALQAQLHTHKTIGRINRVFADFGLTIALETLPSDSRLTNPAKGAGALLDVGLYSIMWASLALGNGLLGNAHSQHNVTSVLNLFNGFDESNIVILGYPDAEGTRTAICTSTLRNTSPEDFCRIEGSKGIITIFGPAPSRPSGFRVLTFGDGDGKNREETFPFDHEGMGFYFEADAVARNIHAGERENKTMPLGETMRIMRLLDTVRREGGLVYPQDKN